MAEPRHTNVSGHLVKSMLSSEPTSEELLAQWSNTTKDFSGLTGEELKEQWNLLINTRDDILEELQKRNLYPSIEMNRWELETGAYPSQNDPEFLQKLLSKREFAESLQTSWIPKYDRCAGHRTSKKN